MSPKAIYLKPARCLLAFAALVGVASSCRPHGAANIHPAHAIPADPPESTPKDVWDALIAPTNVLVNPPSYTGHIVRDALLVRFNLNASVAIRSQAIAAVAGEVLGGRRLVGRDGYYVVKVPAIVIPGDSSSGPLLRARAQLMRDPSVRNVLPLVLDDDLNLHRY